MAQNFIHCDREQQMLMPLSLRDWLPDDHLVWFVIDSVEQIDLSSFYARHREDGWGRAAFEPQMMVTLLLYAYSVGARSAREIERRLTEDVAFRIIAANHSIDHATICRFRTRHRTALSELFVGVLGLCADAGMVRPGVVAIDGTKIAANASVDRNLTKEQLEEFARRVFDEAEAIDAREDELYGERRGDEMPEHLRDRTDRIEWLKKRLADQQRVADDKAKKPTRRKARINTTDPDSALQKTAHGYLQGYNAQAAVSQDHFFVAADLTSDNTDVAQLGPMLTQAKSNLESTNLTEAIATVVADNGYFSDANTRLDHEVDLLIAPAATRHLSEAVATRKPLIEVDKVAEQSWEIAHRGARHRAARREVILSAYAAKRITAQEAAQALRVPVGYLYHLKWQLKKHDHLKGTQLPAPPPRPTARQRMLERFAKPDALTTYGLRATTVEPLFGQLKEARGMRRFLHRGLDACRVEWRLMASAHNLRRLWATTTGWAFSL